MKKVVSRGLRRQPASGPHPDADLLSAFAERALSDTERKQVAQHLGSCSDCRDVLYLASPASPDMQTVLPLPGKRSFSFALRWATLAAAVVAGAVLFIGVRNHNPEPVYKNAETAKSAGSTKSAELKTPPEVAEMRAATDQQVSKPMADRVADEKVIPTPKHMTAKPAAELAFDQSGQVRVASGSSVSAVKDLPGNGRGIAAQTLDSASAAGRDVSPMGGPAPSSPSPANAIGGLAQNNDAFVFRSPQAHGALANLIAQSNLAGTIVDRSGAVIPNAMVNTVGPIGSRAVQSDAQGRFWFAQVVPGEYQLRAAAPGFKTTELQEVAVLADKPADLRVRLELGSAAEQVQVTGANAALEVTTEADSSLRAQRQQQAQSQNELSRKKSSARLQASIAKSTMTLAVQWTLAADGSVQRSFDLGKTWQAVANFGGSGFRALSATGTHVWVAGNRGALYHSPDSGQTWTLLTPAIDGRKLEADIKQVDFSDGLNGAVTTSTGEVWTTSNAGQSWSIQ